MASAWGNAWGAAWGNAWGSIGAVALPQPELPVHKPGFRSVDAKSVADVYNRGQPEDPDYEWSDGRKFYQ